MYKQNYYDKYSNNETDYVMPAKRRKLDNGLLNLKSEYQNRNDIVNWQNEMDSYIES